jgi:hypothetical protein
MDGSNLYQRTFQSPTYSYDSKYSMRCGRGNMDWAATTDVLTVQAGDTMQIVINQADDAFNPIYYNCADEEAGACSPKTGKPYVFIHDGPVFVHLSKAPDGVDIHEYDGSGEWVKIYSLGLEMQHERFPDTPVHWLPRNSDTPSDLISAGKAPKMEFKIPTQTPPGDYLLRMSQVWLRTGDGRDNQFYPSCAHLRVKSNSTAQLPEGILIPEDMSAGSPGAEISMEMFYLKGLDADYAYGSGGLWDGENLIVDRPIA